jgi:glutamine amidotransferase
VIALIDYKAGNLTSVKKALATIGAPVFVPASPEELGEVGGIIVPGVGHFGATRALDAAWIEAILARVGEGRPLLGICLGMQWLYEGSDEAPDLPGLGLLGGHCYRLGAVVPHTPDTTDDTASDGRRVRLPASAPTGWDGATARPGHSAKREGWPADRDIKVPHVGWNSLAIRGEASIVDGIPQNSQVYFTHSYAAPITGDTVAVTEHGEPFAAIVQRGYIAGVQFHPEKSGDAGLRILRNFVDLVG